MLDVVLEVCHGKNTESELPLSILVVLDVVLEVKEHGSTEFLSKTFNPCCAGCSSGRGQRSICRQTAFYLSILVVLDVVLEVRCGVHERN